MKRGKALCRILAVLLICALVAGFAPVAETISAPAQETAAGAEPVETVTDVLLQRGWRPGRSERPGRDERSGRDERPGRDAESGRDAGSERADESGRDADSADDRVRKGYQ